MKNITPIFGQTVSRQEREQLLGQRAVVVWMVGLSGSGKSTLAMALEEALHRQSRLCFIIDGDNLRSGLNKDLGFSEEDRMESMRRAAETARLLVQVGVVCIVSLISPLEAGRKQVKEIVGAADFLEVYVNVPLASAIERDVKGLYRKAEKGEIKNFTGIDSPFEEPQQPDLELRTDSLSIAQCTDHLLRVLSPRITFA